MSLLRKRRRQLRRAGLEIADGCRVFRTPFNHIRSSRSSSSPQDDIAALVGNLRVEVGSLTPCSNSECTSVPETPPRSGPTVSAALVAARGDSASRLVVSEGLAAQSVGSACEASLAVGDRRRIAAEPHAGRPPRRATPRSGTTTNSERQIGGLPPSRAEGALASVGAKSSLLRAERASSRKHDSTVVVDSCLVATLSKREIFRALQNLARELQTLDKRPVELLVVGGAAMVLLYDARGSTKDVDAVALGLSDNNILTRAAARVASKLDLPRNWLNDGAKGYLHGVEPGATVFEDPPLRVRTAATQQLLAMKLCAWRDDVDISDARLLLSKLEGSPDRVWRSLEPFLVPGRELKARYAFEDLWEGEHGNS